MTNILRCLGLASLVLGLMVGCGHQDVNYQVGELDSGLKTVVWEVNDQSAKQNAELRLIIKTGSLAENDKERGFAHFVEHLAFNNTQKYPKETLFRRLEAFGLSFGAHSNAQTGFDSTIYKLSLKDVTDEKLERAMDILAQWAMHVQFEQAIVDAEKGVIREEWRLRKPQEEGWQALYLKALHQNSRYADRLPIGDLEVIESASAKDLEAFYKRWYRPDNAAILVTGAVKTDHINQLIEKYFSSWKAEKKVPEPIYNISLETIPQRQLLADEKVDGSTFQLNYFIPASRPDSREAVFDRMKWIAALTILDQRLEARLQETAGKVDSFYVDWNYPSPDVLSISLSAGVSGDGLEVAARLITEEVAFLLDKGITDEELEAWKYKKLEGNRTFKDTAGSTIGLAVRHILHDNPLQEQFEWIAALEEGFPKLTANVVNSGIKPFLSESPQVLIVHNPSIAVPPEAELKQWLASAAEAGKARKPLAPLSKESGEWAINPVGSGEITTSRKINEDLHEWTLSNGMTVYYQYSDKRPGKVWYQLSGAGGMNGLSAQESMHARLALETISASGLRDMNGPALAKWLSNQNLGHQAYFGFFDRGIYGHGGSKNFAKMMRVLHVSLTEGRVSPQTWEHNLENNRQQLMQLDKSRTKPWRTATDRILFGNDLAFRVLTLEELNAVTPEHLKQLYDRGFSGAQNYRLSIVGDVKEDDARRAVVSNIASLPESLASTPSTPRVFPRTTSAEDITIEGSGERSAVVVHRLTVPKTSITGLRFDQLAYLRPWLNAVMLEELREKDGLVYSVDASFESGLRAVEDYTLTIQLACDPEKVTEVRERIGVILRRLANETPESSRLLAWQETRVSALKDSLQNPGDLASAILSSELTGLPLEKLGDVAYRTELPEPEDLSSAIKKMTSDEALPVWMIWLP